MEQGAGFETNTICRLSVQVVKKSVGQMRFLADVGKHWVRDMLHLTSTPITQVNTGSKQRMYDFRIALVQ